MMATPLLIGIGNELRGDDAVGLIAVRRFAAQHPDLRTLTVQQLTADLALGLGDHDPVVFVDAD